jgi:hypothetical protein
MNSDVLPQRFMLGTPNAGEIKAVIEFEEIKIAPLKNQGTGKTTV